ncbi:MAG TPA: hypothetical protein VMI75_32165 [Polyangiaceae bacterium]|nr:hypothetical protein [Polyangiaceae bacterium]
MSEQLMKVKACEHKDHLLVFSSGEDAPGKSLDTLSLCQVCGALVHDYRHNGGQRSPNYPIVYSSPMLTPFLSVCQELIDAQRVVKAAVALRDRLADDDRCDEEEEDLVRVVGRYEEARAAASTPPTK